MSKLPEVGDTVVIRGVVTSNDGAIIQFRTPGHPIPISITAGRLAEIIPKPWEPKVGDTVWINGKSNLPRTLLALNGDGSPFGRSATRRWAVVAYEGDIPEVYFASQLRKDQASCAD